MLFRRMCGCSEDKPKLPETSKRPEYDEVDYDISSPNYRYQMTNGKRGEFIIINNENFTAEGCDKRPGTDVDAGHLKADFEKLGFNVTSHKDLTALKMKRAVEEGNHCIQLIENTLILTS
jgi:stress response protein SCP2